MHMIAGYDHEVTLSTGPLGGLGDLLLYSTLPERLTAEGHRVFLSDECIARNDEVFDLVWGLNPFIRATGDKRRPTAGYTRQGLFYDTVNRLPLGSAIEAMERAHGLPPPYGLAPKVYYTPKPPRVDVAHMVLLDMHSLSSAIHEVGWMKFLQKMNDRFGAVTIVTLPESVVRVPLDQPEGTPSIGITSLYEYCDVLANCRAWLGSEAGAHVLAAAVRGEHDVRVAWARPDIVCLMAPNTFNSRGYCFAGVDYRVSKLAAGDDYLEPVEVPLHRYHEAARGNTLGMRDRWRLSR